MSALPVCDWDHPNTDPYQGTLAAAVAAYGLPIATQAALVKAFERREYEQVEIGRDTIKGNTHDFDPEIRDMHYGARGRYCHVVTRAGWDAGHTERALVVCADGECVGWPSVCRNAFRLTRRDRPAESAMGPGGGDTVTAEALPPIDWFGPTAAGTPGTGLDAAEGEVPNAQVFAVAAASYYAVGTPVLGGGGGGIGSYLPLPPHVAAVPEPETWALLAVGLGLLAWRRRAAR